MMHRSASFRLDEEELIVLGFFLSTDTMVTGSENTIAGGSFNMAEYWVVAR